MLSKHSLLFLLAGVFVTLAMVSAKGLPGPEFMNSMKKAKVQPCCFPDAFETNFGEIVGYYDNQANTSGIQMTTSAYSYDATAMKVARNMQILVTPGGSYLNVKTIEDYAVHRSYLIYPNVNCTYSTLPGDFEKTCVPANAIFAGSSYLGVAEQTVDMHTWLLPPLDINDTVMLGVDANHCAPISVMALVTEIKSSGYMSTGGSTNMTLGIKDPSVFDPPEGCRPAAQKHATVPSHLTKYRGALFP